MAGSDGTHPQGYFPATAPPWSAVPGCTTQLFDDEQAEELT